MFTYRFSDDGLRDSSLRLLHDLRLQGILRQIQQGLCALDAVVNFLPTLHYWLAHHASDVCGHGLTVLPEVVNHLGDDFLSMGDTGSLKIAIGLSASEHQLLLFFHSVKRNLLDDLASVRVIEFDKLVVGAWCPRAKGSHLLPRQRI